MLCYLHPLLALLAKRNSAAAGDCRTLMLSRVVPAALWPESLAKCYRQYPTFSRPGKPSLAQVTSSPHQPIAGLPCACCDATVA